PCLNLVAILAGRKIEPEFPEPPPAPKRSALATYIDLKLINAPTNDDPTRYSSLCLNYSVGQPTKFGVFCVRPCSGPRSLQSWRDWRCRLRNYPCFPSYRSLEIVHGFGSSHMTHFNRGRMIQIPRNAFLPDHISDFARAKGFRTHPAECLY